MAQEALLYVRQSDGVGDKDLEQLYKTVKIGTKVYIY